MNLISLTRKERTFFEAAESVSQLSDHRCKLGCVIVDHHRIISSGHNSETRCHRIQKELDGKFFSEYSSGPVHAELDALLPLIKKHTDITSSTVYLFRKDAKNNLAMSRPCPRCMSLLKKYGIKKVKYTTPDGFATEKIV